MKRCVLALCIVSLGCTKADLLQEAVRDSSEVKTAKLENLKWDLSASDISSRCQAAQKTLETEITRLLASDKPDFENVVERADRAFTLFANQVQALDFHRYVLKDTKIQNAAKTCFEESERLHLRILSRRDFYTLVKKIAESGSVKDPVQTRLLKEYMHTFKENGLSLSDEQRQELLSLRNELVKTQTSFSQTLNAWDEKLHFTKEELLGLPETILSDLERSKEKGKDYVLTLKYPHVVPALKYVKDAKVRKTIYEHFKNRGGVQNSERLAHAISLRLKLAKLLGYKTFAAYRLDDNMAKKPENVWIFLSDLESRLKARTQREFQSLLELKRRDFPKSKIKELQPWDEAYYDTILMKEKYEVSEELIKQYFPVSKTIEGMLHIYETIFDLDFKSVPDAAVWHPDVQVFRVLDKKTKQVLGQFYMDLFPREGKYNHAANFGLINGYERDDGLYMLPISAVLANFNKPTKEQPGLLNHDEVQTLFHEFGHVMHHVLSRAKYGSFSGTNVKRDFVEAPSQMMENWVWDKSMLKSISSHYKTGESMPEELIDRLIKTRYFDKGIYYTRQVFYASVDMAYHTMKSTKRLDVSELYHLLFKNVYGLKPLKTTKPEASFDHIMGGYEAGYYGYLWSEVYACDMFTRFEKEGLLNVETGREYRKMILEQGGSQDPMDLVRGFLKREPNNDAFLRLMEEKASSKN